ncbi:electron transfer flavoprotein subunit alpha/FixB family protein [Cellulomonas citrea]|uniref:electron transfer flavoprotein subunit alpha/FixB family protein n=1 Tax=Cellulomonas citrea TaxID=1909423 RepID=UPI00135BEE34|nr:electron transfer flavoprotein subunit alpha/FixB family protein [Cellulomonas citrea]
MTEAWILVYDQEAGTALTRSARALADRVVAVSLGAGALATADLTLTVDVAPGTLVEAYARPVAALLAERGATLVLAGADVRGRLLAGQVAAHLGVSPVDVAGVVQASPLVVTHPAYGGVAVVTEEVTAPVAVLVVAAGAPGPAATPPVSGSSAVEASALEPEPGLVLVETRAKSGEQVNLASATRVVGVGRGFGAEADLDLARAVAAKLGAELACSRPIAEGVGWMPAERYVGVSGATIAPDLYLAVGISGQVQHLVGVRGAKVVVAINKDKNAPIFAHADLGVVGDLYEVLPALVAAL